LIADFLTEAIGTRGHRVNQVLLRRAAADHPPSLNPLIGDKGLTKLQWPQVVESELP